MRCTVTGREESATSVVMRAIAAHAFRQSVGQPFLMSKGFERKAHLAASPSLPPNEWWSLAAFLTDQLALAGARQSCELLPPGPDSASLLLGAREMLELVQLAGVYAYTCGCVGTFKTRASIRFGNIAAMFVPSPNPRSRLRFSQSLRSKITNLSPLTR